MCFEYLHDFETSNSKNTVRKNFSLSITPQKTEYFSNWKYAHTPYCGEKIEKHINSSTLQNLQFLAT
jgi:hypothetical protein